MVLRFFYYCPVNILNTLTKWSLIMNKPPSCKLAWLSDKFVRYII